MGSTRSLQPEMSEKGINRAESVRGIASPPLPTRNLKEGGIATSTRNLKEDKTVSEVMDEEQKNVPALSKLPAAGFNRLKGMWANRESMAGFSSPLSTWSRPYGNHKKGDDNNVQVTFDPKTKTYSGKYDADRINGEKFQQFGCAVVDCPRVKVPNYKEGIPSVLILLRDELEKQHGFLVEGVFRVAASFEDQRAYKVEVDNGSFKGCRTQDDAMCMAALLKEWFRTMPVRLLNALPLNSVRSGKSDIDKELPEPNFSVFMWLCDLMADVVNLEQVNRMSARAMAIVIAPNLYSAGDNATPQEMMQEMNGAVSIVETALKDCIAKRKALVDQQGGGGQ